MKKPCLLSGFLIAGFSIISATAGSDRPPIPLSVVEAGPDHPAHVLQVKGKCEYSADGVSFKKLDPNQELKEGSVLRTSGNGRVDIGFSQTGAAMRVKDHSEVALAKMRRGEKGSDVAVDLHKGTILTIANAPVMGVLSVSNSRGGTPTVRRVSDNRFVVTANDGSPQKTSDREVNKFAKSVQEPMRTLVEFDELHQLAETWMSEQGSTNR